MDQAQIEELKKEHGDLFKTTVHFPTDEEDFTFIWRAPRHEEWQKAQRTITENGSVAGLTLLLQSICVDPDAFTVASKVQKFPIAFDEVIAEKVLPLIGFGATQDTEKL